MIYDRDYYIDSDISNYKNYPDKHFDKLANDIIESSAIVPGETVLDFGCALGGLVESINNKGISCVGTDISYWAINEGREKYGLNENVLQHYSRSLLESVWNNIVIFLDVLEHIEHEEIEEMMGIISCDKIFVRIPVALREGEDYAFECSRADKTHKRAHSKDWWNKLFNRFGFSLFKKVSRETIYDSDGVLVGIYKRKR